LLGGWWGLLGFFSIHANDEELRRNEGREKIIIAKSYYQKVTVQQLVWLLLGALVGRAGISALLSVVGGRCGSPGSRLCYPMCGGGEEIRVHYYQSFHYCSAYYCDILAEPQRERWGVRF